MRNLIKHLIFTLLMLTSVFAMAQNAMNAEGRKHGPWVILGADAGKPGYAPDAKVEEGTFENGRKVGMWKMYYPSGKLKSEINHEGGRPKGPYKTYYENGVVEEEGNWALNKQTGNFKRYYENGQVSQQFTFNETGKREGKQTYFYENGQVMIEGNWNGGKEDGEIKEYFEDGSVKSVRVFDGGNMDASKSTFKEPPSPQVAVKAEPEPVKDESNKVKTTVKVAAADAKPNIGYFDGNGQHTLYNKNRQISQKGEFKSGRLWDGKWYKYDSNGILTNVEIYQNGQYIGEGVIDPNMK
ncbi:MAG: toxin-antitoxin system YwqK family antitoxin [Flavobacteriales bacterium]